jgi:integrase
MKFTKASVAALKPKDAIYITWDDDLAGFGIRVMPSGAKTFILKYRVGKGRTAPIRKPTLGKLGDITLDQARQIAVEWKLAIARGDDPSITLRPQIKETPTVADLCRDYMERHGSRKRTGDQDQRFIDRFILPALGKKEAAAVNLKDIEDLHLKLTTTPYQGNRVLALLSKMFGMAVRWGWCLKNPASGISKFHEERRERFLSPAEIERLAAALEAYHSGAERPVEALRTVTAIRLLMLTGSRRNEVLSARWEQFDLETGVWIKPSSHTKQKKQHRIPLAPAAIKILTGHRTRGEHPSGYVFPARTGSSGHMVEIKNAWARITALAGLAGLRLHDLRHTYASILASGGMSLPIIGRLLGHTQTSTTARYSHLFDDPLREATKRVAAVIEGAGKSADIIKLGRG